MISNDDIEAYLIELDWPYESKGDGVWVLHDEQDDVPNIVMLHVPPVITVRLNVVEVPEHGREELFETLLRFNATDLVHGAYGIENNHVVLTDTIQSPNLDLNELQYSIESVALAISSHRDVIYKLLKG